MTPVLQSRLRILRAIRHKAGEALDDVAYRRILQRCAGVDSSTKIRSLAKADAVLDEFRRLGIGTPPPRQTLSPQQRKMWSLWQQLADARLVKNRKMPALAAWVKRQTGVDALGWLPPAQEHATIERLKRWLARGADGADGVAGEVADA